MRNTITEVRNAVSLQSDNLRFYVEIKHQGLGWIPYTLDPADTDTTIDNDAVMALIGTDFAAYVAPTQEELDAKTASKARKKRNSLLSDTDWMANSDVTMSSDYASYRQALRDIPSQSEFPNTITWPTKPS